MTAVGVDDLGNWRGLSREADAERRRTWLDTIAGRLDKEYPGFAGAIAQSQFLNARSMHNYLGTPGGAVYGFAPEPPSRSIFAGMPRSPATPIPGLFLASAFGGQGGFTGAMGTGADAARLAMMFEV